ncbi:uncharacterized protein LOC132059757 [Lycium ferocissimum]|uniref:uncharacterized protein LOC132059757 n=1 Tax=Lycium ferocissimum TaxID=112874 RepID=UPI0028165ACC|nr:uncharacterized protein LOC132059757 [Lycium ferocissimum]
MSFPFANLALLISSFSSVLSSAPRMANAFRVWTVFLAPNCLPVSSSSSDRWILGGCFTNKSTFTFTLAQLGLVLFAVVKSTVKGLPTTDAIEKIVSLAEKFGDNSGKLTHATATDVSSSDLNQWYQINGHI